PLQLRMRTEANSKVVFHDAVVEHARFRGTIQSDRDVADSSAPDLRLLQNAMEQVFMFGGPGFDDLPVSDSEPGADDRATAEGDEIRPVNLAFDRFRTHRRLETTRGQCGPHESAADVVGADDAVAHDRQDGLRLEPQVGPRIRLDS